MKIAECPVGWYEVEVVDVCPQWEWVSNPQRDWCSANCAGKFTLTKVSTWPDRFTTVNCVLAKFEKEIDAILFLLKWGTT